MSTKPRISVRIASLFGGVVAFAVVSASPAGTFVAGGTLVLSSFAAAPGVTADLVGGATTEGATTTVELDRLRTVVSANDTAAAVKSVWVNVFTCAFSGCQIARER